MKLIQIFLPLYDSQGAMFPRKPFDTIKEELTEKFGGITIYQRAPAVGLWKENESKTVRDEIIIHEVMSENFNSLYWKKYKKELEETFNQDVIIIRVSDIQLV